MPSHFVLNMTHLGAIILNELLVLGIPVFRGWGWWVDDDIRGSNSFKV